MAEHPILVIDFLLFITLNAGLWALITYLLGLWARWSLSPIDKSDWGTKLKAIPRKWMLGMICVGTVVTLADLLIEWRGRRFETGWTAASLGTNTGVVIGEIGACILFGLTTGYVSRRGLKNAIADDELGLQTSNDN